VGSGKTVVAAAAILNVLDAGYQCVLMAPTEILAKQHYSSISKFLLPYGFNIQFISGSTTESQKKDIIKQSFETKNKILVVEDEEVNYFLLKEILTINNIPFVLATNGKEAVEACAENKDINLVLMDIKMPIMDGHSAAEQIKSFRPELPIIAQSAYALEHEIEKYSGVFDNYITKPFSEEQLTDIINQYAGIQSKLIS
ncbi:MAG: response regulator, partial [Bacteroidales bacterium]|nr:response regulator [Bacteroidales bacterium]